MGGSNAPTSSGSVGNAMEVISMCEDEDRIDAATVYSVTSEMERYAEQSRWSRFNAFLVAESIVLLSCASLVSTGGRGIFALVIALALIGALLGPIWCVLGARSNVYHSAMHETALALEKRHIRGPDDNKPHHRIDKIQDLVRAGRWWNKLSSSTRIVICVPLLFSAVFIMIVAIVAACLVVPRWGATFTNF